MSEQLTIGQVARLAIDVQDACNLSGVVHSFARITDVVWETVRANNGGTREVNRHPVCVLFASKIADLSGQTTDDYDTYATAYDACKKLANVQTVDEVAPIDPRD